MVNVHKIKILVVDDKPFIRQLIITGLVLKGYGMLEAGDGQEGLRLARKELPALILLDVLMPVMNGPEMLHRLRQDPATEAIPVVLMSAKDEAWGRSDVPGAQAFMTKPFEMESLERMVQRLIQSTPPLAGGEVAASREIL